MELLASSTMDFSIHEVLISQRVFNCEPNTPMFVNLPLKHLVGINGISPLFLVDRLELKAYAEGDHREVPVKFTLMDCKARRVLTSEPSWHPVEWVQSTEARKLPTPASGTNEHPFKRFYTLDDEDNRVSLINALRFLMSKTDYIEANACAALSMTEGPRSLALNFECACCQEHASYILDDQGLWLKRCPGRGVGELLGSPGLVCCTPLKGVMLKKDELALQCLVDLLHLPATDMLPYQPQVRTELNHLLLLRSDAKYLTELYRCVGAYAENLCILTDANANVKLMFESPAKVELLQGKMSINLIYGESLAIIHDTLIHEENKLLQGDGKEDEYYKADMFRLPLQAREDVILRRRIMNFFVESGMTVQEFAAYIYTD